ncbi:agenet-like domain, Agenet domain [Artemisia annua]|uniref:Agenet-like domain, Agenet domain n=1 Tax=Artemisia annua TaxID=35608 RepID=A0A2U1P575_ARTAN|nr:agenet-like domain, Agenet domain [Artemisia annua]
MTDTMSAMAFTDFNYISCTCLHKRQGDQMRFKKGNKVEVMNNEMPATWRAAEILSADRDAYNVKYDGYKGAEKVSRKFVRPCPPAISLQSWVCGDIVEVFDENSWKIATVLKVLKGGRFLVRPHGFAHEMKVQKMNVRTRQSWRDGQWVPVGKGDQMRFKKGNKVEVMNNEMPATWRAAEILSADRDAYNVKYDGYKGAEKVSRKFVRPCPPAISLQSWVCGDIVEVFDENSWKIATVLKVLKGGRFLVRPHGFAHEMKVQKMNVRTRQSWRDGQWVPVGKIAGSYGDMKTKIGQEDDSLRMCNDARLQESFVVSKNRKRASPFCSSFIETCPPKVKKVKPTGHSFEKSI